MQRTGFALTFMPYRTQTRKKAALPHATQAAQGIGMDTFFVTDSRDPAKEKIWTVYSYVDLASAYHMAGAGSSENPDCAENARTFQMDWMRHYGPPEFIPDSTVGAASACSCSVDTAL